MMNSSISQNAAVCVQTAGLADIQPHPVIALADQASAIWPENAERFHKAADLVAGGFVDLFETDWQGGASYDPMGRVWSQEGHGRFYVIRRRFLENELAAPQEPERYIVTCECEDYKQGRAPLRNGQRFCKHVAAYRMAVKLAETAEADMTREARRAAWQARQDARRRWQRQQIDRQTSAYNASTQGARRYTQMTYAGGTRSFAQGTTAGEKFQQVQAVETAALLGRINEELYG